MERIFLVEDEIKLRNEVTTLLQRNGYQCMSSDNYEHIVEDIIIAHPDLLLVDFNLPVYDGF